MPSPKFATFEIHEDDERDCFDHPGGMSHVGCSKGDGFDEIISATLPHFAKVEDVLASLSIMWKRCYGYIASGAIPERLHVSPPTP
ncbi:uncharacterized protein I303_104505 [Kwoniella dejecticola CBS 10117]|uniref:Uncharacterized protein n=1 Tax=Kwoniella dejecticola CBS 10117 TaxID=1296121 RepID=A0A1A6A544_9TREE|nr:uncharacterized protein I303_04517 [Kwoniella dejecticola CBS 10117]OBR85185.1 hypothetical protein I303_04517 [Kwoniella dejecticola CBS 10117]